MVDLIKPNERAYRCAILCENVEMQSRKGIVEICIKIIRTYITIYNLKNTLFISSGVAWEFINL